MSTIPSTIKLPLVYGTAAAAPGLVGTSSLTGLLFGQAATNTDTLYVVSSAAQAASIWGRGSIIHRMAIKAFATYPNGVWFGIGVPDAGGGTAATWTITVTAPADATSAGTLRIWLGDEYFDVGVSEGDTDDEIATAIAAAFPSSSDVPFTGGAAANVATLTCRHKGTVGNIVRIAQDPDEDIRPGGVSIVVAAGVTGATDPTTTSAVAAMADVRFDMIAVGLDAMADAVHTEVEDRWDYDRMLHGYVFTCAAPDSYADLYTEQTVTNVPTEKYMLRGALETGCYTPAYEVAAWVAAEALRITDDDATAGMDPMGRSGVGTKAADRGSRFTDIQRNNLLRAGYTTFRELGGRLAIDRCVGVRFQDDNGARTEGAYDEAPKVWLAPKALLRMVNGLSSLYGNKRIISDTSGPVPATCATPSMIHDSAVSIYAAMARLGWVEDVEFFDEYLSVTKSTEVSGRVDGDLPMKFADNLYVMALALTWQ